MKKIVFGSILFISLQVLGNSKRDYAYPNILPDTSILPQILILPLNNQIGKPVDGLFAVLPVNYRDRDFMPMGIGYSRGVFQSYGTLSTSSISVQIFVDTFQFMTFPNRTKTTTWNMNLAKQETISYIRVLKNNVCVYGCNNPNYYQEQ